MYLKVLLTGLLTIFRVTIWWLLFNDVKVGAIMTLFEDTLVDEKPSGPSDLLLSVRLTILGNTMEDVFERI